MSSILLAGGTGTVGREVVKGLSARGFAPRVLSRDPEKARHLFGASIDVVPGDLVHPASLADPLRGVEVAYVATTPGPELDVQESNFFEAARAAGVRRVVKLSAYGVEEATDRIHGCHAASERRLKSSGLGYVILEPVMFMSNLLWEAATIKNGTLASTFADGRMSFVDPRDVAELAVLALTSPEQGDAVWAFGGPEALSYDDVAGTFSRVLGRRVEHLRLDDAAFRRAAAQLPEIVLEAITSSAVMAQEGKYEVSDRLVNDKLGRRARSLESWVAAHRAAFTD
ncbi:MAG TPA: NAD(P)H-binding protein [Polyangiaceae bacterium]